MEHARYLEWREKYQSLNQKEDRPFSSYRDNKNSRKQYLRSGSVPITRGLKGKSHRRTMSTCVKHNEIEEYEDYNSRFQRTMSKTTCRTTAGARTPIRPIVASGSQLKDEEIVEAPQSDSTASMDRETRSKSIASLKMQVNATPKPTKFKPSTSTSKAPVAISSPSSKNNKEKSNDEGEVTNVALMVRSTDGRPNDMLIVDTGCLGSHVFKNSNLLTRVKEVPANTHQIKDFSGNSHRTSCRGSLFHTN